MADRSTCEPAHSVLRHPNIVITALLVATIAGLSGCGGQSVTSVSVTGAELAPYKNAANGKQWQEVITTWTNTGNAPVRVVDANIVARNRNGDLLDSFNYTIYAGFDDDAGVAPGETYTTPSGSGFKLPDDTHASSVEVTVTSSLEHSGM